MGLKWGLLALDRIFTDNYCDVVSTPGIWGQPGQREGKEDVTEISDICHHTIPAATDTAPELQQK